MLDPEKSYYIIDLERSGGELLSWWKPNRLGYTHNLDEAGVYSAMEAEEIMTPDDIPCVVEDVVNHSFPAVLCSYRVVKQIRAGS